MRLLLLLGIIFFITIVKDTLGWKNSKVDEKS